MPSGISQLNIDNVLTRLFLMSLRQIKGEKNELKNATSKGKQNNKPRVW